MWIRLIWAAVLLALGCGGPPSGHDKVDDLVSDICGKYNALCVPSGLKEDLPFFDDYLSDFHWGRASYGEFDLPGGLTLDVGFICYNEDVCAENLKRCGFVLLHEIGHRERGSSQIAADCWAAEHATQEQYTSGVYMLCNVFRDADRCAAVKTCGPWAQ